jgi:hypothetical protein
MPGRESICADAHNTAPTLTPAVEFGVPQETANVLGNLEGPYVEVQQTKVATTQGLIEKVAVSAHKRGTVQLSQQCDDLLVRHSLATSVISNLTDVNAPLTQLRRERSNRDPPFKVLAAVFDDGPAR